jgi:hypothetical protein
MGLEVGLSQWGANFGYGCLRKGYGMIWYIYIYIYTSRRVPGSNPGGVTWDFFGELPTEPCALRSTQPLKMSTRNSPGGECGRCVELTTNYPSSAESQEIRGLNLPGTPRAPDGLLREYLYLLYLFIYVFIYLSIYLFNCNWVDSTVQLTFTHKQYTEYRERNIHNNHKIEHA